MRLVLIMGTHPRHFYIANTLAETGVLSGIVMQKREGMIEDAPIYLSGHLEELYVRHFSLRLEMEEKYFGDVQADHILKEVPVCEVSKEDLNGSQVMEFIKRIQADTLISYGPGLLRQNILDLCHGNTFNIHGGLSPYYKGAATMFWPFYFLEPNFVGTTIHYITNRIDAGNIVHQTVPQLEYGDCMHEVACKAIIKTGEDLRELISIMKSGKEITGCPQKKNGKLFLQKDWRPEHLKLIYDTYEDKIVDMYLDGEIGRNNEPALVRVW